ncbi:PIN domain-containing protein [Carboxydothermus ferrireducens]|uniref:Nucleic acid-binding protein n=1 Tax=Carboxydothermus ferrireducens DSM 11255 TaxID=1119529 RepID=A0ABX2REH1_9THEO|nr:PIN domain-containing protein [Carboxydothermus ferrireducens]NYE58423.1 putative nucleic acid-binding protein [Carboxydothermus ferrireducens DSM 11255]
MNVLIDTNVILDVLGKREPFFQYSTSILMLAAKNKISASITANSLTDLHYLLKKYLKNNEQVKNALKSLIDILDIVDITKNDCLKAFDLPMDDYEDALLAFCAKRVKADYIITRNIKDFLNSPVNPITPEDFISRFFAEKNI